MPIPSIQGLITVDPGAQNNRDDTMTLRNPQWARWFDAINGLADGGKKVQFGASGGINDLPTAPNGPGMSDLQYGNGLGPVNTPFPSLSGLMPAKNKRLR